MLISQDDWKKQRAGKFTASEVWKLMTDPKTNKDKEAGILSETAMTYIHEKAVEQYTGFRKQFTNPAMEHGIANEKEAFDAFCARTGLEFTYSSKEFYPIGDAAGASPDGVLYDGLEPIAVLDVKCPQPVTYFEELNYFLSGEKEKYQGVNRNYFYQLQLQMLATGARTAFLAYYLAKDLVNPYTAEVEFSFDGLPANTRLFFSEVKADEELQNDMLERINKAQAIKNSFINKWSNLGTR